jgi:hypothetical protein
LRGGRRYQSVAAAAPTGASGKKRAAPAFAARPRQFFTDFCNEICQFPDTANAAAQMIAPNVLGIHRLLAICSRHEKSTAIFIVFLPLWALDFDPVAFVRRVLSLRYDAVQPAMPCPVLGLWPDCLPALFPASLSLAIPRQDRSCAARMGKIAKQIDPNAEMDLPDKAPGMHWSRYNRLAERFSKQRLDGSTAKARNCASALASSSDLLRR